MREVRLSRRPYDSGTQGTFGDVVIFGADDRMLFSCVSLELPERDNVRGLSCIPEGEYVAKWRRDSPKNGAVYELQDVEGRSYIQIHPANLAGDESAGFVKQLDGCIALGFRIEKFRGGHKPAGDKSQKGVTMSRATVDAFTNILKQQPFKLIVEWAPCTDIPQEKKE